MLTLLSQYSSDNQEVTPSNSSTSTPGHTAYPALLKRRSSTMSSKMEKEQWNAIQLAIGDSQRFLDLLNNLKWESGLSTDAVNLIKSRLAMDDDPGTSQLETSHKPSNGSGKKQSELITIAMARHAAESAAHMCNFAISIVKYNESFKPYMIAKENLERFAICSCACVCAVSYTHLTLPTIYSV